MATSYQKRPFTGTTQLLDAIRAELPRGSSITNAITLLHIFDICGESGITAKDVEVLTGESAPTVSRILKTFTEGSLITYQQFALLGPKLIFLTDKGEALKQRVYQAQQDTVRVSQLQDALVNHNVGERIKREQASERKEIQQQYKEQGRGPKGEIMTVSATAGAPHVDKANLIEQTTQEQRRAFAKQQRDSIRNAVSHLQGSDLRAEIKKLKAGMSQYVFDQLNRAKRDALRYAANGFDWRGNTIEIFDPEYGWKQNKELDRHLIRRHVWFYYNKGEDPTENLPVAIQRDFDVAEFGVFMDKQIARLNDEILGGVSDASFSGTMDMLSQMLNTTQFKKARDLAMLSFADVNQSIKEAAVVAQMHVEEAEHKAKALHSFANSPTIPVGERTQFRYDAYGADREAAEARAERDSLQQAVEEQKAQIDKLTAMMTQLMEDKNDKE